MLNLNLTDYLILTLLVIYVATGILTAYKIIKHNAEGRGIVIKVLIVIASVLIIPAVYAVFGLSKIPKFYKQLIHYKNESI